MSRLEEAITIVRKTEAENFRAGILSKLINAICDSEQLYDYNKQQGQFLFELLNMTVDSVMNFLYPEENKKENLEVPEPTENNKFQDEALSAEEIKKAELKYNARCAR